MGAHDPTLFNVDPYFDDYSDDKKFLRILYKPGFAVQARELTQAQTILQTQIQRFGDHVFKDGSIVSESSVSLNSCQFVRVNSLTGYAGVSLNDFIGLTASVSGKNTIKILDAIPSLSGSNYDNSSIFVFSQYLEGPTAFSLNDTIQANYNGTVISASVTGATSTKNYYTNAPTDLPAFGDCSLVGVDAGIRYIKGYFVNHDSLKLTPFNVTGTAPNNYRIFNNLNSTIYFGITGSIISSVDDETLNDPAFGSYNYAAPGADRFRLDVGLLHQPLSTTADYTLITIENGEATYRSNYPEYNVLADSLARRTYDQSGNFTVEDFPVTIDNHPTDDNKLRIKIGKGKAYIFGYEFINYTNKVIDVNKPRNVKEIANQQLPILVGSQLGVRINPTLSTSIFNTIDFNTGPTFWIGSTTGAALNSSNTIGYLRLQNFNPFDSEKVVNVYDVKLTTTQGFENARGLYLSGYTGSNQHIFELTDSTPTIRNANYSSLVFPLSNEINAHTVTGNFGSYQFNFQKSCTASISVGNNTFNIDTDFGLPNVASFCEFQDVNNFEVFSATGSQISGTVSFGGGGSNTRQIVFNSPVSGVVTAIAKFNLVAGTLGSGEKFIRGKSPSTKTATLFMKDDGIRKFAYLDGDVDVYNVVSVTGTVDGGGATTIGSYFELDTGQRDNIYDWSRLIVKPEHYGKSITSVSCTYTKFNRVTSVNGPYSNGPFCINSYAGLTPASIPVYTPEERSGIPFSLGSCFDFRPDRSTPASFTAGTDIRSYTTVNNIFPIDVSIDNVTWNYYLPRTDKLVLTKDKTFKIIEGIETEQAPAPPDTGDAMTIGTIFYYPYTKDNNDVIRSFAKNIRYTMRDIGNLEKRIDRLEYYTTLSLAEKDANNLEITDTNGLNKFKNGIFVDSFNSLSNSDYQNSENVFAVDQERKEIRPKFRTNYIDYALDSSSGLTTSGDNITTLTYNSTNFITQKFASKSISVNPFNVVNYNGSLIIDPSSDDWIEVNRIPDVILNQQGENDGIADGLSADFGTIWNNWETNWSGRIVDTTPWQVTRRTQRRVVRSREITSQTSETRTGERTTLQFETLNQNLGERVVDVSVVPFMRAKTLTIKARGLRPGVRVYPFFDGVDVSSYFNVATLIPNSKGELGYDSTITFSLPAGVFRTGQKILRLIDNTDNVVGTSTSCAENTFVSSGVIRTEQGTIVSTRIPIIRRENVTEERVFNTTTTETRVRYRDPVAETFLVDPQSFPNGLFLHSVNLYFAKKSANLPVYVEIRPAVNGYPSSSTIVPFSEVYKNPDEVSVSDNGTTPTTFRFSSPVYLPPGEHSIVIISNSDDYHVWVAEVGKPDVSTNEIITTQPYSGVLFKSQNSSTWTAEQTLDLKFDLNRCVFTPSSGSATFDYTESLSNIPSGLSSFAGVNVYRQNATYITPPSTEISCSTTLPDSTQITLQNNQNYVLPRKITVNNGSSFQTTYTFETTNNAVSPILDLDRVSGLYTFNIIQKVNDIYKDQYEKLPSVKGITTSTLVSNFRYLSKRINLQQGFESNDLNVYFSARIPYDSDVRVYVKTQLPTDNTSFDNIPFEKLVIDPSYAIPYGSATGSSRYISSSEDDYVDLKFIRDITGNRATSGITGQSEFKSFQVKIVMYGNQSDSNVPAIKDLKCIAT